MNTTITTHTNEDLATVETLFGLVQQLKYEGEALYLLDDDEPIDLFHEAIDLLLIACNKAEDAIRRTAKC